MSTTIPEPFILHPSIEARDLGDVTVLRSADGRSHVPVEPSVARALAVGTFELDDAVRRELQEKGFFDGSPTPRRRVVLTTDGLEFDAIAKPVHAIATPLGALFTRSRAFRALLVASLVFGIAITVYCALSQATISSPRVAFFLIAVLGAATTVVHELCHAVVLAASGRRVGRLGVGMYWGAPCFYVDSTDAHFLDRRHRIAQACAGVAGELMAAGPVLSVLLLLHQSFAARAIALLSLTSVMMNMSPMFKLDGYWALSDALRRPRLAEETLQAVADFARRRKADKRLVAWGVISGIGGAVLVVLAVITWLGLRQNVIVDLWSGALVDKAIAGLMVAPIAATLVGGSLALLLRVKLLQPHA